MNFRFKVTKLEHGKDHGCYIVFDRKRVKFIRSSSASTGIGHEIATVNNVGLIDRRMKE